MQLNSITLFMDQFRLKSESLFLWQQSSLKTTNNFFILQYTNSKQLEIISSKSAATQNT